MYLTKRTKKKNIRGKEVPPGLAALYDLGKYKGRVHMYIICAWGHTHDTIEQECLKIYISVSAALQELCLF